jgi:hypothetical protein
VTTEAPPVAEASRSWRWHWVVRPLAIYAASRAVSLVAFILTVTVASVTGLDWVTGRPWPAPPAGQSPLLTALTGWDGSWYVQIAHHGYGEQSGVMAFFPGYPMSIRLVAGVTGLSYGAAAVVAALAWGAVASVLLWALSSALGDRSFADRSTALFAFFPGSFVFTMAYSEPMMLAASIGCLLALHHRRWVVAGLCGAVATATRPNALVLVACGGWAAVMAIRQERDWKALAAPGLSLAGVAAYFAFLWRRTGSFWAWFDVEQNLWKESFSPTAAFTRAGDAFDVLLGRGRGPDLNPVLPTLGLAFVVAVVVLLVRWRPPVPLVIYTVGILVLAAGSGNLGLRPRFIATAFPLSQALARRMGTAAFSVTLGVFAALLGALTFVSVLTMLATP